MSVGRSHHRFDSFRDKDAEREDPNALHPHIPDGRDWQTMHKDWENRLFKEIDAEDRNELDEETAQEDPNFNAFASMDEEAEIKEDDASMMPVAIFFNTKTGVKQTWWPTLDDHVAIYTDEPLMSRPLAPTILDRTSAIEKHVFLNASIDWIMSRWSQIRWAEWIKQGGPDE